MPPDARVARFSRAGRYEFVARPGQPDAAEERSLGSVVADPAAGTAEPHGLGDGVVDAALPVDQPQFLRLARGVHLAGGKLAHLLVGQPAIVGDHRDEQVVHLADQALELVRFLVGGHAPEAGTCP